MKKLESIKSDKIRTIRQFMIDLGFSITYLGQPWSNVDSNWIYFDTELNKHDLIAQFDKDKTLEIYENTDARSGLEKGLIDPVTKEGVMGLAK